ncbi:MAG: glycosyltransferase [Arachnia sp.]
MRIALLGPSRNAVAQPFAGGQESYVATLSVALREQGHRVILFAAHGSDPTLADETVFYPQLPRLSEVAALDFQLPEPGFLRDQHAFLGAVDTLITRREDIDVVHNNSLHHLPLAASRAIGLPLVTTLHTPPFPWMELGVALCDPRASFAAVSANLADQWTTLSTPPDVILNGVATTNFAPGRGGTDAAWVGRLVPEKGADLAVRAARRAGWPLRLIGPLGDQEWFDGCVRPVLGQHITYEGHLTQADMALALGVAAVTLMTPRWPEPFGLVAVESALTGTPVLALDRGGLREVIDQEMGVLVAPRQSEDETVAALAAVFDEAAALPRQAVRERAMARFSIERMVADYEHMYERAMARW